jgi:hypothetical protein
MTNLIQVVSPFRSWLKQLSARRVLGVVLVGFLVLGTAVTSANAASSNPSLGEKVQDLIHQDNSDRPKTTGEWEREAREVEGSPGKRLQNIAGESAEAVKEFGALYPDTAERTANSEAKDLSTRARR